MEDHEEELKKLFIDSSVAVNEEDQDIRIINYNLFKVAIDYMMNKAYYYGVEETKSKVSGMVDGIMEEIIAERKGE